MAEMNQYVVAGKSGYTGFIVAEMETTNGKVFYIRNVPMIYKEEGVWAPENDVQPVPDVLSPLRVYTPEVAEVSPGNLAICDDTGFIGIVYGVCTWITGQVWCILESNQIDGKVWMPADDVRLYDPELEE